MPKKFKKIVDLSGNQIRKTNLKRKPKIGKSSAYTPKKKTPKKKNTKTNEIAIIKQEIETLKNEVNRVNATRQKAVEVPQEETIHIPTEQEDKMLGEDVPDNELKGKGCSCACSNHQYEGDQGEDN